MLRIFLKFEHICLVTEFEDQIVAGTSERGETDVKLIEDASESPNVRSFRSRLVVHTLRWHVLTRTDEVFVLTSLCIVVNKRVPNFRLQKII